MTEKVESSEELRALATKIANGIVDSLIEQGIVLSQLRVGVGFCGPSFDECNNYTCRRKGGFDCTAATFKCTGDFDEGEKAI